MRTRDEISVGSLKDSFNTYPKGKTYLFFIGIDKYKHPISTLSNAVRDVEVVANCLIKHYDLDQKNLILLCNEQATSKAIIAVFDQYTRIITDEDNLLFYFSGHGYFHASNQKGYWLTADSISGEKTTFLSNDEIISYIKNISARHIFGIVDACFSEALFYTRNAYAALDPRYNIRSRWLLTAGRLEPVSDGLGDHSPFAEALLENLAHHPGPHLWVSELCIQVLNGVAFNSQQRPRGEPLHNVGHKGGEFLFLRKGQTLPALNPSNLTSSGRQSSKLFDINSISKTRPVKLKQLQEDLAEQLTENEWKKVFGQLNDLLPKGNKKQTLRQLQGIYNQTLDNQMLGFQSPIEISRMYNELRSNLYRFIETLKAEDLRS